MDKLHVTVQDIAVFTNDVSRCNYYQTESQNVAKKNYCKFGDAFYESLTEVSLKVAGLRIHCQCFFQQSDYTNAGIYDAVTKDECESSTLTVNNNDGTTTSVRL